MLAFSTPKNANIMQPSLFPPFASRVHDAPWWLKNYPINASPPRRRRRLSVVATADESSWHAHTHAHAHADLVR